MKEKRARESGKQNAGFSVSSIPFEKFPGQARLFLDYLADPQSLREFYPNAVETVDDLDDYSKTVLDSYTLDRQRLCDALREMNRDVGAGSSTFENIVRLSQSDTVAVVTGQQAGMLTGPIYTIYKALSAVKLAERLTSRGRPAVPVFWAATEDHDLAEVAGAFTIDSGGALRHSRVPMAGRPDNVPVGDVAVDDEIRGVIDELLAGLPATQYSAGVRETIDGAWVRGELFGHAFGLTLMSLLGKFGLVYLDPRHAGIKRLSSPIYARCVERWDGIADEVTTRGRRLIDCGYHNQVLVENDHFPLFWHDEEGRRLALRRVGDGTYRIKDSGRILTSEVIRNAAEKTPERLSPGVMFRPVVQDLLLPTICYLGGAAEIAYFAQNSVVYEGLGRPVTPVFHRQSLTIVESRHRRTLDRTGVDLIGLFGNREEKLLSIALNGAGAEAGKVFAEAEDLINIQLNRLDQAITPIDVTVAASLARRRKRIAYHLSQVQRKTVLAKLRNDEAMHARLSAMFDSLVPNGALQERSLNIFTFVVRYGWGFIDWIYDALDLEDKDHRVVEL